MAGGVALSEGVRGIVVHMKDACFLDAKTISYLTGIPLRTVYNVLAVWRKTGETKPAPEGERGRPRALDFGDTQVSQCIFRDHVASLAHGTQFLIQTVTRRNDMYLEELREVLEERCGVHVSESTIWRTLQRVGFRMKEVRNRACRRDVKLMTSPVDYEARCRAQRAAARRVPNSNRRELYAGAARIRRRERLR